MPRNVTRAASLLACLAWTASCSLPVKEVGKAPEGEVREKETEESRALKARREDARHARRDAEDASQANPEERRRLGTPGTKRYHLASCEDLKAVPNAERVLFDTPFAGLDAGYAPCPRCSPGP